MEKCNFCNPANWHCPYCHIDLTEEEKDNHVCTDTERINSMMDKRTELAMKTYAKSIQQVINARVQEARRRESSKKNKPAGVKHDAGKLQWNLLPLEQVEEVVRVLTKGAKKYAPDNWKYVVGPRSRYYDAAMRHISSWVKGRKKDKQTGCSHLAHAICCLIFLMWFDKKGS